MTKKELKNIVKAIEKLLTVRDFLTRERKNVDEEKAKEYNKNIDVIMIDILNLLKPTR